MLDLFKKLFTRPRPSPSPRRQARLRLEAFESRDLLNASPMHSLAQLFSSFSHGPAAGYSHDSTQTLSATLTGATGTSGSVSFTSSTSNSGQNTLKVQVSGLTASTAYTLDVGTTAVGTLTTDANGKGSLTLSNLTAPVAASTTFSVLDGTSATVLTGTFATNLGCHGGTGSGTFQTLAAPLTGATGTAGTARFISLTTTSGENDLHVRVSGLTASTTYTLDVGGTTVGTLTTNAKGNGSATLKNLTTAVAAGTTFSVLDGTNATVLSGTFAVANSGHPHPWG